MNGLAQLKKLPEVLKKIKPQGILEMGLIIKQPNQPMEEILGFFSKEDLETFKLNKEVFSDDFLKKLIEVFEQRKWLIVEMEDDSLGNRIYGQLRLLSTLNRLQIFNLAGNDQAEINLKQPEESRIIFVTTEEILAKLAEKGFNRFLNLFGPVIWLKEN